MGFLIIVSLFIAELLVVTSKNRREHMEWERRRKKTWDRTVRTFYH